MLETTPMLADSDLFTLIIFVFFALLSGVSSWLQKRREAKEADHEAEWGEPDDEGAPQPSTNREAEGSPLERELRRLLMGGEPPAPGMAESASSPAEVETEPTLMAAGTGDGLASLKAARRTYEEASHLGDTMAEHMAEVDARTEHPIPTPIPTTRRSNFAVRAARAQLLHPATARQAIIASVILAPPLGLQQGTGPG